MHFKQQWKGNRRSTTVSHYVKNQLPSDMASYSKRTETKVSKNPVFQELNLNNSKKIQSCQWVSYANEYH